VRLVVPAPTGDGDRDYRKFDMPTVMRKKPVAEKTSVTAAADSDPDYLDIPAFLRRQAD
jgi:hypothetical protein